MGHVFWPENSSLMGKRVIICTTDTHTPTYRVRKKIMREKKKSKRAKERDRERGCPLLVYTSSISLWGKIKWFLKLTPCERCNFVSIAIVVLTLVAL